MIRVLVVDDDFMVARIHVGFVDRIDGFEVVGVAHSGAEAAGLVAELRPDLLLLDLYLPDHFGLDLLADLRRGGHPCDAIAITAARESEALKTAIRLGVSDYLLKPFTFPELQTRLERYAAQRSVLETTTLTDQSEVDRALRTPSPPSGAAAVATSLPKGLSAETSDLVTAVLAGSTDDLSAADVAELAGLSRVSARRYLEHFVSTGAATVRLRYGTTGRPQRLYRRAGA